MASLAPDDSLTLAPFHRIYESGRDVALLADAYFTTRAREVAAARPNDDELAMPAVIPMLNRAYFDAALTRWLEETAFDSLPDEMKEYESFSQIVQQGSRVVPLIAASLRRSPSFLFLALEEIFEENPVPEDAYGNLQATVSSWLKWLQR